MSEANRPWVLLVDDERAVLSTMKAMLVNEPYDIEAFDNAADALVRIRQIRPCVVLTDYYMPDMNGPTFLQEVRTVDEKIVRIVLTGRPDVTALLMAVEQGAVYRFLLKPVAAEELRTALQQALEYHQTLVEQEQERGRIEKQRAEQPGEDE